ncbi:MAG: MFS transporter [Chloroflexi bacterium]|nr:MFS transporter [Chloroflexota bacterium]
MPTVPLRLPRFKQPDVGLRALILSFYLPALMVTLGHGLLVPILPLYAADFEISYVLIGLVLAGEGIGTLIADVPTGMIQRRFGNKQVMMMGLLVKAVSLGLLFFASSIWVVLLLRLITGFGRSMYTVSAHVYITNHVDLGQRGKAISMYGGTHRLGGFIGPAIGGLLAGMVGMRTTFLAVALATAIGFALVALFTRGKKSARRKSADDGHGFHIAAVFQQNARILASAGTAQVFGQMIRAGRTVIIPLFAADALGLAVDQIGLIISISVAVDFSLFMVAGWLMDRYGRKFAIVPCFGIQALGMALVPFAASFGGLLFAATLIGLGNGLGAGSMMTLGSDLSPARSRGEFLGVWRLIGDVGHTGAPLVVGVVADALLLSSAIWVIAGSGLLAASIFTFLVPETLQRKPPLAPA